LRLPVRSAGGGYAKFRSRSHDALIRVYDESGNVIETHEHAGDFKNFAKISSRESAQFFAELKLTKTE